MIHTSITADAEVRRLRKLGEAKHDWCDSCPQTAPHAEPSASATLRRIVVAIVRRGERPRNATPVGVSEATSAGA